jgi:hypothetical protein
MQERRKEIGQKFNQQRDVVPHYVLAQFSSFAPFSLRRGIVPKRGATAQPWHAENAPHAHSQPDIATA